MGGKREGGRGREKGNVDTMNRTGLGPPQVPSLNLSFSILKTEQSLGLVEVCTLCLEDGALGHLSLPLIVF